MSAEGVLGNVFELRRLANADALLFLQRRRQPDLSIGRVGIVGFSAFDAGAYACNAKTLPKLMTAK